jgi:hypothetical protein
MQQSQAQLHTLNTEIEKGGLTMLCSESAKCNRSGTTLKLKLKLKKGGLTVL